MKGPTGLLAAASGVVGLVSYGCSLALAHLLAPADYAGYAATAALLATAGAASAALIPLPLAHAVRAHAPGTPGRERAQRFSRGLSMLAGLVAAGVLGGVTAGLADLATAMAAAGSAFALFAIAPVWGVLQGEGRFGRYALLTVAEVAVRLAVSLAVAAGGGGAAGPIAGFAAGALVVHLAAGSARPRPAGILSALLHRGLARDSAGVAAVQVVLSAMTVADVVVAAALVRSGADPVAVAAYQAVATPAKAPVWVAVSSALVGFPAVRAATPDARPALVRGVLGAFVRLGVPATVAVATLPAGLALLALPDRYAGALALLPWLAAAGFGVGATTVVATLMLAARDRAVVPGLVTSGAALAAGIGLGATGGVDGLARGACAGALVGAAVLAGFAHRRLAALTRRDVVGTAAWLGFAVALLGPLRGHPVLWAAAAALLGLGLVGGPALLARLRVPGPDDLAPDSLHVLHLAFEDPAMPGSGGGALRTAETGRRLAAAGHHLTIVTTRHPAVADRVERHGTGTIRWVHAGIGTGRSRAARLLGYVLVAPLIVRATPSDLLVEDFFAPISSFAAPWWGGRPTVGVVQWLNARQKWREYRVPVHLVERLAVRSHRRLVAMSDGVAADLARLAPRAEVTVLGNGFDRAALAAAPPVPRGADVVFVGRLEIAQKGLDLLLDAWVGVPGRLVVAGTGPDEEVLRARAAALGIADRVVFAGWTAGPDKFALLASARVAVVPSRFETFGIVAVEALAAGTPVVAFDIPCLREVVPADAGTLVPLTGDPSRDAAALAVALRAGLADDAAAARAAVTGPRFAARFDWDAITAAQEAFYRAAVATPRHPVTV